MPRSCEHSSRVLSVLIVRGAYGDMYEPAWLRALLEIGVQAEIFDCHSYTLPGLLGRIEQRVLSGPGVKRLRRALISKVQASRPDIVLLYQGHYIDKVTICRLAEHSFVTGYHNDDPFGAGRRMLRYRHFHKALPAYHGYHVYRQVNVPEILAAGVPRAAVLMPAFLPWIDYPRQIPEAEKKAIGADLFFAGHCEPDQRSEYLLAAVNAGLNLRIHGDAKSWNMYAPSELLEKIDPIRHVVGDDYRRAICAAQISLCFFSKKNRDQYTRRVFEIAACGGFLMAERTPAMMELLKEGIAAEYFSDLAEFIDKAKFYAGHREIRDRIANNGRTSIHAGGHDLLSRMRQWLADIEQWRSEGLTCVHSDETPRNVQQPATMR